MPPSDSERTWLEAMSADDTRRWSLVVIADGFCSTFPLPTQGDVLIGRTANADIRLDLKGVSRQHAILHMGPVVTLEDLGSSNGTRIAGRLLEKGEVVALEPRTVIEIGSLLTIVQRRAYGARPRRVWTHGYFEARLEEECERGARLGTSFALVRARIEGARPTIALEERIASALRPGDLMASYAYSDYEVLIVDAEPEQAEEVVDRIRVEVDQEGATARVGVAFFPGDGRTPEVLMERVCAMVRHPHRAPVGARLEAAPGGPMAGLIHMLERVAASNINVLLLGETGVGKEVLAERLHRASSRAERPMLRLNCAALSESLLESELFGHERGAFTGATQTKQGLLETAEGGTVFLDEVGDLPVSLQAKLLRVLEDRVVLRVGSLKGRPIDVRFVAATHRDLEVDAERGTFRKDLYYRLNGVTITVPPLRERVEEIAPLARQFVARASADARLGRPPGIAPEAIALLERYAWPGNVRELKNVMERAVILCDGFNITLEHLPVDKMVQQRPPPGPAPASAPAPPDEPTLPPDAPAGAPSFRAGREAYERQMIVLALEQTDGNQTQAAKLLGISRRHLITRMEHFGMPRPRKGAT